MITVILMFYHSDFSLMDIINELYRPDYVTSEPEAFIDIPLSGSFPPVDELVSLQLEQDQCEYNTWSALLNMFH